MNRIPFHYKLSTYDTIMDKTLFNLMVKSVVFFIKYAGEVFFVTTKIN